MSPHPTHCPEHPQVALGEHYGIVYCRICIEPCYDDEEE